MTDPLTTATQLSLGYAFYDMDVSVLAFVKIQMHRPVNTMFLYSYYVFVQKGV